MPSQEPEVASPLPRSAADRIRAAAMPLLLVAVASVGVYRSVTLDQSSWQGASFGMFATYDNVPSRTVVVTFTTEAGRSRVSLPDHLHDDATRLRVVPTDERASRLADEVAERVTDPAVTLVEVEVRRIVIEDRDGLRLRLEPVAEGSAVP